MGRVSVQNYDHTTEEGQIALNAEFKRIMVLKPDGAGGSRASMRKRWLEGYSVWKKLADSDESDRVKLEVYLREAVWRCMMYGVYGCMAV